MLAVAQGSTQQPLCQLQVHTHSMQLQQGSQERNGSIPCLSSTATSLVSEAEYGSVTLLPQAIQAGSSIREGSGSEVVLPGFLSAQHPPSFYLDLRWSSAGGLYSTQSASCCPVSSSWSWTLWAFVCLQTAAREFLSRSRSFWDTQSFSSSCQTRYRQRPSGPPSLVRLP